MNMFVWRRRSLRPATMSSKSSLRCAAQAATGHLTRVKYINLQDMELPSIEDMHGLGGQWRGGTQ